MEVCVPVEVEMPPHGVAVLESRHRADFFMPWRNDSFAKVMYILGGSGRLCLEDREVLLGEEQLCIVPAGCRHRLVDDQEKPVWLLGLCLDQSNPAWSGVVGDLFEKPEVLTNPGLVQEAAMGLKRLLYEQSSKKRGWGEMQVACCAILLVKLLRGRAETGELKSIDRVRWYAEEMASSFYLNEGIDEASRRLGLSRRRFTQLFREVTGEPWLQRLRSLRIEHACRLLSETGRSIKAVAFECGFESQPQFFRTFRQRKGTTPGQWRKSSGIRFD